ncbi:RYR3 protein, partial [Chroicocephalus maculipennis]|nr:RYR3 protein [Chroicocephalus maculipennis]
ATLKELISQTMVRWSQEDQIQDPELVRVMYTLLRRQYDSIGELLQALRKAYTISAASVKDTINLLAALGQIRSLLSVRMGKEEELLMINGLGYGINIIFFLSLCKAFCYVSKSFHFRSWMKIAALLKCRYVPEILIFTDICKMAPTDPFCSIKCRWSQYRPLRNATHYLSKHGHRAVDCNSLSMTIHPIPYPPSCPSTKSTSLQFRDKDVVVTYLAGCGLQSCPVLLAKGYPDIGWNPIEGERYLSFLRFAVFVN